MAARGETGKKKKAQAPASLPARIWHQVGPFVWAVALALLIRAVVFETFYVPSGSMLPTLLIGDHVFVSKFSYGARIPFTQLRLPATRDPARGDVVIFELGRRGRSLCPRDECPDAPSEDFVKRIVGMPGDTIQVRGGVVTLNGERVDSHFGGETFEGDHGRVYSVGTEMLDGAEHSILDDRAQAGPPLEPTRVPEGRYFMMGDNRDNSTDSRFWGTVRREELAGPVIAIYWSWDNRGSWLSMLNPLTWWRLLTTATRWERFGDRVR